MDFEDQEQENMIYNETSLKSVDGKNSYPVDFVRELFINSDRTIDDLAVQLNVNRDVVKKHAARGLQSWYKLKSEKLEQRMRYFMDVNIDNLIETHAVLEDTHFLAIIQLRGMQDFLKAYYTARGHLFRVNEDGELSLDPYGLPIPLPLPNSQKELLAIESILKLKEGTKAAMNQIYEAAKAGDKKKEEIVDVDAYGLFEDKK